MTEPTDEGMRRYLITGGYNRAVVDPIPCTCSPSCAERCAGECGCGACILSFTIFCDDAGLGGFEPWTQDDRRHALEIYRDTNTPFAFQPSLQGFRRYPHTNGRYAGNPDLPCQCVDSCEPRCDGACACSACEMAFTVFCEKNGLAGPTGLTVPMEDALAAYRRL
jgi:hypothetical protein